MAAGTVAGFVGPSEAGQSTTIRMLLGLITPSSGTGSVLGIPLGHAQRDLPERRSPAEGPTPRSQPLEADGRSRRLRPRCRGSGGCSTWRSAPRSPPASTRPGTSATCWSGRRRARSCSWARTSTRLGDLHRCRDRDGDGVPHVSRARTLGGGGHGRVVVCRRAGRVARRGAESHAGVDRIHGRSVTASGCSCAPRPPRSRAPPCGWCPSKRSSPRRLDGSEKWLPGELLGAPATSGTHEWGYLLARRGRRDRVRRLGIALARLRTGDATGDHPAAPPSGLEGTTRRDTR